MVLQRSPMIVIASQITGKSLFVQQFVKANIGETMKAPHYWHFVRETIRGFPEQRFNNKENVNVMTSSWPSSKRISVSITILHLHKRVYITFALKLTSAYAQQCTLYLRYKSKVKKHHMGVYRVQRKGITKSMLTLVVGLSQGAHLKWIWRQSKFWNQNIIWGLSCQKQVSQTRISNHIPQ